MAVLVVSRLIIDEESLEQFTVGETKHAFQWALDNLLSGKVMPVEDWLQTAFHLCKQRWDQSIDWMETLPVPKVMLMVDILNNHVKEQDAEMKKAAKKKK